MATGTPQRRGSGQWSALELTYPGKTPRDEVLAIASAPIVDLWSPPAAQSGLLFGDNLQLLASLRDNPAVRGKVQLVYIDPPYSTETVFHTRSQAHAYDDVHTGHEFIEFLRQRLILLHDLLAEDGSLYLHLDEKAVFHARIILDEVFGRSNYRNCIVRKKCNPKNFTSKQYGNVSDYILFYTKTDKYIWNKQYEAWTDDRAKEYQYIEPETGRRFMKVPVHAPGTRQGATGKEWRGNLPPKGKHWQYTPDTLDEMDARGELYWSANGNPRRKVYLDQSPGISVQDIWLDYRDAHNQNVAVTGYPTEKNPDMMRRLVAASSNVGGLVLDAFAGSGTTLEAAHSLGRRWIGIDDSAEALRTMLYRFAKGLSPMGDFVDRKSAPQPSLFEVQAAEATPTRGTIDPSLYYVAATPEHAELGREVMQGSAAAAAG
jgi:adenine-specific DNA-methyltransferase